MKALVVGDVQSGSGKTTVALALMAAFAQRGLTVQPFKIGPDYIDPGHHAAITGRASHNLDGWMLPHSENAALFARAAADADIAIVEGVMGLYDGVVPETDEASTARLAKDLSLPVLLVADAKAQARTFAAVVLGMRRFDPDLRWLGVAGNRVGSARHTDLLAAALRSVPALADGPAWLGGLPRDETLALPERHLGLVTADDAGWTADRVGTLADWIETALPLDRLLAAAEITPLPSPPSPATTTESGPVIAVARDAAFCFYYAENLRRLEAAGARLAFFSPPADADLYDTTDGQGRSHSAWAIGRGGLVASYVHLHFGSQPEIPHAFVRACRP